MKLNAQTDFGLRVLMLLSTKTDCTVTIQESAQILKLSQPHLMKVCAKLTAGGFVASARGRNGGLALGRPANQISVEEVIRFMEPDFGLVECFREGEPTCSILPACVLNVALTEALEAFFHHLRQISIQDLVSSRQSEMREVLAINSWSARSPSLRQISD
jgi:Rrf2 family nitric oxide-sensitive transcriptional repressor